ncbi:MAG TPA: hypothetical protein VMB72_00565 [Acidimicrobiales bacterium]|nr:hypothetical protein [Acidimicrobiales bacterium]
MSNANAGDRRFRPPEARLTPECRLCWRPIVLEHGHIETTEQHVYVRCPHCGGSFPIRRSDHQALLERPSLRLM